jgi:hypothetical protein
VEQDRLSGREFRGFILCDRGRKFNIFLAG